MARPKEEKTRPSCAPPIPALLLAALILPYGCQPSGGNTPGVPLETPERISPADTTSGLQKPRPPKGRAWVIIGPDTVDAEVADSEEEREEGLMGREEIAPGSGMLFVWETAEVRSFWMQNTLVSLDIAFIDASFAIIDIQQMEAETEDVHTSAKAALFALEVAKGWLAERGVRVGDKVKIEFGAR